jgi:hypothetical protein
MTTDDPKIHAWRLISAALDDDPDTKGLYSIAALREIRDAHIVRDVLCELADIAAMFARSRYGDCAYLRALQEIEYLIQPEPERTPRPHKDRPINRRKMI